MCPKCNSSDNVIKRHIGFECVTCGVLWLSEDEEPGIIELDLFNPLPRFKLIESGHCPECNGKLDYSTGGCGGCHIVPALDPDYQVWLKDKYQLV